MLKPHQAFTVLFMRMLHLGLCAVYTQACPWACAWHAALSEDSIGLLPYHSPSLSPEVGSLADLELGKPSILSSPPQCWPYSACGTRSFDVDARSSCLSWPPSLPRLLFCFVFCCFFLNYESGKIPNNMKIKHDSLKIALGYKKTPLCS